MGTGERREQAGAHVFPHNEAAIKLYELFASSARAIASVTIAAGRSMWTRS